MRTVATVDIGTNTVLLLVARGGGRRFERILERQRITRLGKGVDRTRALDPQAIERSLEALREYVDTARQAGAQTIRAVGTSALRDASNRQAFLDPAVAILGSEVEVISGDREAELTFYGATENMILPSSPVTVFDVGGGSTEFVVGEGRRILQGQSLDVGSVRLHERLIKTDPPLPAEIDAVRAEVHAALQSLRFAPTETLIGIAGTLTTLAAIAHRVAPYDGKRIHGVRLTRAEVDALLSRLASMTLAERCALPGLEPGRADVIVAGCALVAEVLSFAESPDVFVSDGGVRVGLAMQMLEFAASG